MVAKLPLIAWEARTELVSEVMSAVRTRRPTCGRFVPFETVPADLRVARALLCPRA